ncbi:hypothetical protein BD770DRAFT_27951 [Pilaira anomala]|nr:hypothetical protein BD770DRAFT_27951 [Pilaira anomala]
MSHREALHNLFAIAPPTIEETILQEKSRKNEDRVEELKPIKPSLKRAAETVSILDDSPSSEKQQPASMHINKRLKTSITKAKASSANNLKDPCLPQQPVVNSQVQPPTCPNKRKEFDLSEPEQKTCKKLKPTETNIISKPTPTNKRPGKTTLTLPSSLGAAATNKIPGKITMTPPNSLGTAPTTSPTSTKAPKEVFLIDKLLALIKNPPVTRFVSNSPPSPKTAVAASSMDRGSSAPIFLSPSPAHRSSASVPAHGSSASPPAHISSVSSPQTVTAGSAPSSSMARTSSSPTFLLPSAHKSNASPSVSLDSISPSRCSESGLPPPSTASTSATSSKNIPASEAPHQLSSATAPFLSSSVPIPALSPASKTHQAKPIDQTPPKTAAPKLSKRAKKRLAWKNKKKKELAKKAANRHVDVPKATDECDFDTLLKQFEEASSKSNTTGNSAVKNNKSNIPKQAASASAAAATQKPLVTKKAPVQKPPAQKPPAQKPQAQKPQAQKSQAQKPQAQKPQAQKPQAQKPQAQKPAANQRPLVRHDQQHKATQNQRVASNQQNQQNHRTK